MTADDTMGCPAPLLGLRSVQPFDVRDETGETESLQDERATVFPHRATPHGVAEQRKHIVLVRHRPSLGTELDQIVESL